MGNCWSSGMMMRSTPDGYKRLVCDRCHRPDHSRYSCYEDTYADGSYINWCYSCRRTHRDGNCPYKSEGSCVIS